MLARGPQDRGTAVLTDPRTVLMDLATGRLLARRYVKEEIASRTRTLMQGEVRVYLLDGSTSMLGPRARMRDSILVAELATLLQRLDNPDEHTRVVLHYRYFNTELGPVTRVDTSGAVIEAIADVTGTPRTGGTDIEGALVSSLELIAEAQRSDSELARAQIVLITDGVASVREEVIRHARQALGDLPVGVSVIALGEENPALREVVAYQRARCERAFYHYLPDDYLEHLASARVGDDGIHLPSVPKAQADPTALEQQLGSLLDDLSALSRSRDAQSLQELDRIDRERRLERADIEAVGEGERARLEALYRDDRALLRRYERWFPAPLVVADLASPNQQAIARAQPVPGTLEHDDLDSMMVVLASVAEVVEAAGSTVLGRQADAIDLLERLLPDARLSPARYHELLRAYPVALAPGLDAVRGAVQAGLGWRIEYGRRHGRAQSIH
ncbi:MAG: VWA domain-containing protein [Deltaproteobacteria bacterium]|nr:VWA domain-containing protein [Deltaproteobacteria bacterium]